MIERKYSWRYGHGEVSAQAAGETIKKIEDRDGIITREALLEESRPEDAPTHKCFEWNDTEAAEKYRLWQAGQVIRDIVVTIIDTDKEAEPVRAPMFINTSVRNTEKARFVSTETALTNNELRSTVLENALSEFRMFRKKYGMLKELAKLFETFDEIAN